ncbi:MAG: sterol carrier family protein [Microcella sp.]
MARTRIPDSEGEAALTDALADLETAERASLATASRYLLQLLADAHAGRSVELRIPPFGAAQIVEGPRHTRGTPPNVVETDARTLIALAAGTLAWGDAVRDARIHASGARSDLSALFPIAQVRRPE